VNNSFTADEECARRLDAEDPLRRFREQLHLPLGPDGKPLIYLAGNSLGLMPKSATKVVERELNDWAKLAVGAHLEGATPHLEPEFVPVPSADAWQVSSPPIVSMAFLRASMAIFDHAGGMETLRAKSIKLTGYLQFLLDRASSTLFTLFECSRSAIRNRLCSPIQEARICSIKVDAHDRMQN
jgi:kynureninase